VGVVVEMLDEDGEPVDGRSASIWGVESDAPAYHLELARDLAAEILAEMLDVNALAAIVAPCGLVAMADPVL
jgi:hypothetical protein